MRIAQSRSVGNEGVFLLGILLFPLVGCGEKSADEKSLYPGIPAFPSSTQFGTKSSGAPGADDPSQKITLTTIPRFIETQDALGVSFTYDNGAAPERRIVETTGGGAGWFDVDGDDFPDLYLVQGGSPLASDIADNPTDKLYRNRAGLKFDEITLPSGIDERLYGQGIAVGDFDGDGFDDVYVTNVGPDTLYQNQGDGTFRDLSQALGTSGREWGSSAAWADLDGDGNLDLFVCQYLDYDPDSPAVCVDRYGKPRICHPSELLPQKNVCWRNDGDGQFTDVLEPWGLDGPGSKSLGLVIADLNADHLLDVYVANDTTANHLFIQRARGSFTEDAGAAGVATDGRGNNQASMGVAFGDYDQDELPDLYLTHFTHEYNTMYRGVSNGRFTDATPATGLVPLTLNMLGFGTVMMDFNFDGHVDLLTANGHIDETYVQSGDQFKMPAQLFSFNGRLWEQLSRKSGDYFRRQRIGRAVATADYDNDGDADVVIVNQNASVAVLQNTDRHGHWLKIKLVGTWGNRRGIGAKVRVTQGNPQGNRHWTQQLAGGTSYCAGNEPALFFGLGKSDGDCDVEIRWPDGGKQLRSGLKVDQQIVLREIEVR